MSTRFECGVCRVFVELIVFLGWPTILGAADFDRVPPQDPIARLSSLVSLASELPAPSEREMQLLRDANDGQFNDISLAEAALLACGVVDDRQRTDYLQRIDKLSSEAKQAIASTDDAVERGKRLLQWMHQHPLNAGYSYHQDNLPLLLDERKFNCVSATTLFNILGERSGLELRSVCVALHVYSLQVVGERRIEIQTTSADGYDAEKESSNFQHEVGDVGLVAVIYRNHVSQLTREKKYAFAVRSAIFAQTLDCQEPALPDAVNNWCVSLINEKSFGQALAVVNCGLQALPENKHLVDLRQAVYGHWSQQLRDQGQWEDAVKLYVDAIKNSPNERTLAREGQRQWEFWGKSLQRQKQWQDALAVYERGLTQFPDAKDLRDGVKFCRAQLNDR